MNPASRPAASPPGRRADASASAIFVGIVCGIALLLVAAIVIGAFGREA